MKKNTIYIKSEEFKYPSKKERAEAEIKFPTLKNFGFEYNNGIESILKNEKSFYETNKVVNLYWWDNCILNKIGKLNNAYVNTFANYNRDLIENGDEPIKGKYIHRLQFDFYAETVYYFLFSARDVVFQILNIYYDLEIKEYNVSAKSIKQKMTNSSISELLMNLEKDFETASKIRNSFTHKFPKNQKDYRMNYSKVGDSERLSAGSGNELKPQEIMENIDESLRNFASFLNELRLNMNTKPSR